MTAKNNSKFYTTHWRYNWSRKYYKNITEKHNINNIWFYNTLKQLKDNGFFMCRSLKNGKQGQEII